MTTLKDTQETRDIKKRAKQKDVKILTQKGKGENVIESTRAFFFCDLKHRSFLAVTIAIRWEESEAELEDATTYCRWSNQSLALER